MSIRGHSEYVEKQKAEKYVRRYGSWKELRSRFIRAGYIKPKTRERAMNKILRWLGFKSWGEYLNMRFKHVG